MTFIAGLYRGLTFGKRKRRSKPILEIATESPANVTRSQPSSALRAPCKSQLDLGEVPIEVAVGTSEPVIFHVQAAALKAHSGFFAAALNKGWKEAEEKVVKLPD